MNATWRLLTLLGALLSAESRCSPTSYYKNCWIRRFPGIYIDVEESLRRGAQLLKFYQEDTALKCSRTCCLTRNSIFHYEATQESVNCFHLHCPSLESCILSHRGNVVLYNITKGVDPDLLVFGKYFNTNVRVLPHHYTRSNASDPLPPDKRQFIHPRPVPPAPAPRPVSTEAAPATRGKPSTELAGVKSTSSPPATTATRVENYNMATTTPLYTIDVPLKTLTSTVTSPASTFQLNSHKPSTHAASHSTTAMSPVSEFTARTSSPPPSNRPATTSPTVSSDSPAKVENGKHGANDTKVNVGRNQSAVGEDDQGSSGGGSGGDPWADVGPGWHVATHTVLVAVAICVTLLLGCCCSVVLVFSWRGHRKRMGRYRTACRGKKGSMRLIKYVLVKENS